MSVSSTTTTIKRIRAKLFETSDTSPNPQQWVHIEATDVDGSGGSGDGHQTIVTIADLKRYLVHYMDIKTPTVDDMYLVLNNALLKDKSKIKVINNDELIIICDKTLYPIDNCPLLAYWPTNRYYWPDLSPIHTAVDDAAIDEITATNGHIIVSTERHRSVNIDNDSVIKQELLSRERSRRVSKRPKRYTDELFDNNNNNNKKQ